MENEHSSIRVRNLLNIDSKAERFEEFFFHFKGIIEGFGAYHVPRENIAHSEQHLAPALIGQRYAVLTELFIVVLILSFLEFQNDESRTGPHARYRSGWVSSFLVQLPRMTCGQLSSCPKSAAREISVAAYG
jgi:hypothetical protein